MRVAVTGTPGTGKTTATERVDADLDVVHLNEAVQEHGLYDDVDEDRDSVIVDLDAVREWLGDRDDVLVESHLAHHLDVDRVVVLRCHPETLETRLGERGDESEASIRENAESEALDVILSEAVDRHGVESVYEVDTTDRTPEEIADCIDAAVDGEREPSAGDVSFIEYL
ncbi:adenylate kinase [Natronoarchaeum philippinense]|uniref:Putative adenylate kinase n=1 Tax=Natronoarchaeum philippinense TaxID=558529 RepID=A0A285N997_NATPI|nr:adenylate kinase family protein [Natronoarchaeum philippinense]SNZ04526.1 adenylate kinase [Natronoarchaeum philippinense]